jgi:ligand-binding sensor domain-containing protein
MRQPSWLTFILLFAAFSCTAQLYNAKDFVHYTIKDGVVDNYIKSIQQDERGYVWIATDAGLCWYDGNSFTSYEPPIANRPLASGYIRRLKKFPGNRLGIVTISGFQVLNTGNFQIHNYFIPDSTSFTNYYNHSWDARFLRDGSFAVTSTAGFYVFDSTGKLNFRYDAYKPSDVGKGTIRYGRDIFSISDHEFLVYYNVTGTAYFDSKRKIYRHIDSTQKEWSFFYRHPAQQEDIWMTKYQLSPHEFIFIKAFKDTITYYDHHTKKMISSPMPFHSPDEFRFESEIIQLNDTSFAINRLSHGFRLFYFDKRTGLFRWDEKKYLEDYKVNCLFLDREQRLWVGTPNGLLRQKFKKQFLQVYSYSLDTLNDNLLGSFTCAYRYKDKLYAGRYSRNTGLVILDTTTMKLVKTISFFGEVNQYNEIRMIYMYHPDTLWLGTNRGILWLDTKTNKYGRLIDDKRYPKELKDFNLAILSPMEEDGYAWLAGYMNGKLCRYHPATNTFRFFDTKTDPATPFTTIKHIVRDVYNNTWIGGHALARWNSHKEIFDTLITVYGGTKKYNDNILMMDADSYGSLWLHNIENGLLQYDIHEKKFVQFNKGMGLASDNVEAISPVINNTIWMAYRKGLGSFNIQTKKSVNFYYGDDIPLHSSTGYYIYRDSASNYCYSFYKNDIIKFPSHLPADDQQTNELMIQKIVINNNKAIFNPAEVLKFKPVENNLVIHYTLVDFESGADYTFAYKLNKEGTWMDMGTQRFITFNNLRSGKYLLTIKAITASGSEKIKEFSFTITPPFWKTTWFLIMLLLILAAMIYFIYRYRIEQVNKKANIDRLLAKTEMKALHAQMNPHFVFNSLNSIMEMVLNDDKASASRYLSNYAQLIRLNLDHSQRTFITLRENIDYLNVYLQLESIRTNSFEFTMTVGPDTNVDEILFPPMLIQPFIENSIWYGPSKNKVPMKLYIQFRKENDQLLCIVEDDGIGIEASQKNKSITIASHTPLGIANVRQRIKILNEKYKLNCNLTLEDKSLLNNDAKSGTKVTLRLPLNLHDI